MNQGTRAKLIERMAELRKLQRDTNAEIRKLRRKVGDDARPWYRCLHCGHDWQGHAFGRLPRFCSRCHTAGWDREPITIRARRPSDPPNPNWQYKGKRRGKVDVATVMHIPVERYIDVQVYNTPTRGLPPPPPLDLDLAGDTFSGLPEPPIMYIDSADEPQPERAASHTPLPPVSIVGVDLLSDPPVMVVGHKDEAGNLIQDEVFIGYASNDDAQLADSMEELA